MAHLKESLASDISARPAPSTDHPYFNIWHEVEIARVVIINRGPPEDYNALLQVIVGCAEAHGDSALTARVRGPNDCNRGQSWRMTGVLMGDQTFDPRPLLAALQVLVSTFNNS